MEQELRGQGMSQQGSKLSQKWPKKKKKKKKKNKKPHAHLHIRRRQSIKSQISPMKDVRGVAGTRSDGRKDGRKDGRNDRRMHAHTDVRRSFL